MAAATIRESERYFSYETPGGPGMLFTTRRGGVSRGRYSSLNTGFSTPDSRENIYRNRALVLADFGLTLDDVISSDQVHGVELVEAGRAKRDVGECDGIFTREAGIVLSMYFADCTPLYFYDPASGAAGLVHAGWRGTRGGIAGLAVEFMKERYGSDPKKIVAVVGPSIGRCCFEVGAEVEREFASGLPADVTEGRIRAAEKSEGKFLVDLKSINASLLGRSGVPPENIAIHDVCTSCERELFYSYRRDSGDTGRMAGFVFLR